MEEVLADFARRYDAVARAEEELRTLSVTASSADGVVEATVCADGRTSAVRFPTNRFKEMSGQELAGSVLAALTTARAEVAQRAAAIALSPAAQVSGCVSPDTCDDPLPGGPAAHTPSHTCWHRVVREARTVSGRPDAVPDRAGAPGRGAAPEQPLSPGPLWGKLLPGVPPPARPASLPAELSEAVVALGRAVCESAGGRCAPDWRGRPNAAEPSEGDRTTPDTA
ncbi:YbaB/EbfC family nucleoid-associated protein [Streptomyces sp. NPDC046870]|uniref:YbaB/EbfC family nucleoid-associated protein n=1 Tax=Streptomyces sp. NPDC046870 TaxID=3155135 RepID=UPI00345531D1